MTQLSISHISFLSPYQNVASFPRFTTETKPAIFEVEYKASGHFSKNELFKDNCSFFQVIQVGIMPKHSIKR